MARTKEFCIHCRLNGEVNAETQTLLREERAKNEALQKQLNEARAQTVENAIKLSMAEGNGHSLKMALDMTVSQRPLSFDQVLSLVRAVGGQKP